MTVDEANNIKKNADLLVDESEILAAITKMGEEITAELDRANPVVLTIMNGGMIFAGQLLTKLQFPMEVGYIHATRYGNETTGAELNWIVKPQQSLKGRTVLLLDDILDEGITLAAIADYCRQQGAEKVLMAVLIEKLHLRKVVPGMRADFSALEVGDRFLFGYGLDYRGYWRNASSIYAVKGL
jgi:hypoxanthine phosphoribosyltransferase